MSGKQYKYCSDACKPTRSSCRSYLPLKMTHLRTTQRGNWAEALVEADLIEKGYEVFRGQAGGIWDFISVDPKTLEKRSIEVRKGRVRKSGGAIFRKNGLKKPVDCYAVVTEDKVVQYFQEGEDD